jgi:hypothetical protein
VFSAIIRLKAMPTPSMTARRMAHPIALLRIAFAPPRTARAPPVKKPPKIAFQGSSFFLLEHQHVPNPGTVVHILWADLNEDTPYLMPFTAQSKLLKSPPHTPKLPPRTGARALRATMAPMRRSPYGELLSATSVRPD